MSLFVEFYLIAALGCWAMLTKGFRVDQDSNEHAAMISLVWPLVAMVFIIETLLGGENDYERRD